jgi:serine/threonine-protein kinase PknK
MSVTASQPRTCPQAAEAAHAAIAVGQRAPGVETGVHGFARALTRFVGRAGPVRHIEGLLEEYRLVTVTGPGGSGKTRLAGEVARRVADRFADGVWLAELTAVRDPAQVPVAVAAALGVRDLPETPVQEALAVALSQRQLLLVLDNCEHVVEAAAALCARLLPACANVRVLATSREPLRMAGEGRYRLAPLALPGPDNLADAAETEAVALFADRARLVDPRFVLDGPSVPAVARLVTRLDGMPLAIELAAARVEALGVTQLLERIDDRFDLLTVGDRQAAGRHRSLADTVAWSYRLLDEAEQRVFRQVSVFPAGFTLQAAEAVAGPGAGRAVLHLVDCSLLAPPRTDPDGRSRYVMLETLRAYGKRLLAEAGEQERAACAVAGYALAVAQEAAAGLRTGTAEMAAARWLDAEDATLRRVLAWAMEHDAALALRLAVALAPWWHLRGRSPGGYPQLRAAADRTVPGSEAWCAAQFWLGRMAMYSADPAAALGHFTLGRDSAGDQVPSLVRADCLAARPAALANLGRIAEAIEDGRGALAAARELGYPAGEVLALVGLAVATVHADDIDGALRLIRQAEQIRADIPGWLARERNNMLTKIMIAAGDLTGAMRSCMAGLTQARDDGDPRSHASLLEHMVNLDLSAGRFAEARENLRESLQIAAQTGGEIQVLNCLDRSGHVCAATGRYAEAVTVWAAYTALVRHGGFTEPPVGARRRREPMSQAHRALGDARARAAEDRGAAMNMAAAAQYALTLATPDPSQPPEPAGLRRLSARERELVSLVAQGSTDVQIASEMLISVRTVGSHLDRIREKTGCRRRADLTRLALSVGLT